ncbi:MAG: protease modulator HflC [Alphaproteobacteria bacterium]|nr:protease modulator HflC [Alphaproteobacteria bacterium]
MKKVFFLSFVSVALVLFGLLGFFSIFIVDEREKAVVLRFGEITRVVEEPGLYFKFPGSLVDNVQFVDDRLLRLDLDDIRVQVRDGRWYLVDAFIVYRIRDAALFRSSVGGILSRAENNMRTQLDASLRRVYGRRSFEAALSELRLEMMVEVRDQIRSKAGRLGIEIVDVRIHRTDLTPEVSQQTFERMRAERLAEAAELRAKGTQESLRMRAEADRKAVIIVADARREAEIMKGEGDAERNRIFANAFSKDPEFFSFYRSLKAYEVAMGSEGSATMLLSPDSSFFRYFIDEFGKKDMPPSP